jgi:ribonucleoside-diphosphate reductase alpha chain
MAKSLVDYIFRYLAMEFVPGYRAANAPKRTKKIETAPQPAPKPQQDLPPSPLAGEGRGEGEASDFGHRPSAGTPKKKEGNGHGPRLDPDPSQGFPYDADHGSGLAEQASLTDEQLRNLHSPHNIAPEVGTTPSAPNLRLAIVADPLSQQGTELQADAPACDVCGSITVRSGTCYKCLNCGNSMGCS